MKLVRILILKWYFTIDSILPQYHNKSKELLEAWLQTFPYAYRRQDNFSQLYIRKTYKCFPIADAFLKDETIQHTRFVK
jgi:hypothetical protein